MKKLLPVLTGLVAGSSLYAMATFNPAAPALLTDGVFLCDQDDCWGLRVGYRGDFVTDKKLQTSTGSRAYYYQLYTNAGQLTLNLWDRLDLYGFVGATNYDYARASTSNILLIVQSNTRTMWGVGGKAVLWETCWGNCGITYIGLDASYESFGGNIGTKWASLDGIGVDTLNASARTYHETQIALGLGHRINSLVPYIGVKWSNANSDGKGGPFQAVRSGSTTTANSVDLKAAVNWGYYFGVSLVDVNRMSVTAEARFIDETAFSIGGEFRF